MSKNNRIFFTRAVNLWLVVAIFLSLTVTLVGCAKDDSDKNIASANVQKGPSSKDLYCEEFTSYSGPFVEDGSNDEVENILAMLLYNSSDEYLELATITYDVGGKTAEFIATGIPPHEKVWVLEKSRMEVQADAEYEFLECDSTFRNDAVLTTEDLVVTEDDNTLTLKNVSKKPLNNPCVYYKNVNSDGNYLGGITYMVGFDSLNSDESQSKKAGHYSENSRIVRFSFQTE